MIFENNELIINYPNNWIKQKNEIKNCLLIIDYANKKSRIMLMNYPNEAVNINHLKSAIELFPRDDNLKIVDSRIIQIKNKTVHELEAINVNSKPPLKTKSIGLINKNDVYIFNYMTFGLNNPEDNDLKKIIENLQFK